MTSSSRGFISLSSVQHATLRPPQQEMASGGARGVRGTSGNKSLPSFVLFYEPVSHRKLLEEEQKSDEEMADTPGGPWPSHNSKRAHFALYTH